MYILTLRYTDGTSRNTIHEDLKELREELKKFFENTDMTTFVVNRRKKVDVPW